MNHATSKFQPGDAGYYDAPLTAEELAQPDPALEENDAYVLATGGTLPTGGGEILEGDALRRAIGSIEPLAP